MPEKLDKRVKTCYIKYDSTGITSFFPSLKRAVWVAARDFLLDKRLDLRIIVDARKRRPKHFFATVRCW